MTSLHMKWPLAGVLSGLVILVSGATPSEAHAGRRVALQEQLGLTEDQVQAIRAIRTRHWESMRDTVRALGEARRALHEMALGDQDEATVAAKTVEVRELAGQVVEARVRTLQEVARVLTPEQRAKLRELQPLRLHRREPLAG